MAEAASSAAVMGGFSRRVGEHGRELQADGNYRRHRRLVKGCRRESTNAQPVDPFELLTRFPESLSKRMPADAFRCRAALAFALRVGFRRVIAVT
jgi:hypothetical protein